MKPFDNFEISPCTRTEESDRPGHFYYEVCEPHEADVWTLYGHIDGEGVEAIGDFATREQAEQTFQRITGIPFADHEAIAARLRVMHAGQKLLSALVAAERFVSGFAGDELQEGVDGLLAKIRSAVTESDGGSSSDPFVNIDIHAYLAERTQIAHIWSVEDVKQERPDLDDDQCWAVLLEVEERLDSSLGITWDSIRWAANDLFPNTAIKAGDVA